MRMSRGRAPFASWAACCGLTIALSWTSPTAAAPACDLCRAGRNQSPVRLESAWDVSAPGPLLHYVAETIVVRNTRRNLHVDYPPAARSVLEFDRPGQSYTLREFHFHAPGEHALGSAAEPAAMEVHFVHQRDTAAAVVGVPISVGSSTHPLLGALLDALPKPGEGRTLPGFDATSLALHEDARMLRYPGSLTTGACDEGVSWFVYDDAAALTITAQDLERYRRAFPADYARPMQPLHARQLVRVGAPRLLAAP